MNEDIILHYDSLIDEGQDPVCDPPMLQDYMNKWDGDAFISLLELNKADSALEIGCGTGRLAVRVAPKVSSFCGIDVSPKTVKIAASHLQKYNAKLICGDFLDYSFTERFDLI